MSTNSLPKGVLLDLDGTLLDTAPDMVAALQPICERLNVPVPAYEFARDYVSMGSAGLLRGALPDLDEHEIAALVPDYLEIYAANLAKETRSSVQASAGALSPTSRRFSPNHS
jgi:N-acetyl-D-muramate 6-phosphate phosphatase